MRCDVVREQRRVESRSERQLLTQHTALVETLDGDRDRTATAAHDALMRAVVVRDGDVVELPSSAAAASFAADGGEHDIGDLEAAGLQIAHERVSDRRRDHLARDHARPLAHAVARDRVGHDAEPRHRRREQATEGERTRAADLLSSPTVAVPVDDAAMISEGVAMPRSRARRHRSAPR